MSAAPSAVYHASAECTYDSIASEGLLPGFGGEVYAAGSVTDAMRFMAFRLRAHVHGIAERALPDGTVHAFPDVVEHARIHVWKIDTALTGPWAEGMDHNPEFFGDARSYVHDGPVPVEALVEVTTFSFQDGD